MSRTLALLAAIVATPLFLGADAPPSTLGHLVIVGGGGTPADALTEAIALTGKTSPRVVVLPQASSREDRGVASVEMWREQGLEHVELLDVLTEEHARAALEAADLIWFPGGAQRDLMRAIAEADLTPLIGRRYAAGAVVGGTSAGAAVMGAVMVSGAPDPAPLRAGAMTRYRGLALWTQAIVDQHFVERERQGRLLTVVLDSPRMIGVGISEKTAVVLSGDSLRVIGEGSVLVYDARQAQIRKTEKQGELQSARDVRLHVLRPGETFAWFE